PVWSAKRAATPVIGSTSRRSVRLTSRSRLDTRRTRTSWSMCSRTRSSTAEAATGVSCRWCRISGCPRTMRARWPNGYLVSRRIKRELARRTNRQAAAVESIGPMGNIAALDPACSRRSALRFAEPCKRSSARANQRQALFAERVGVDLAEHLEKLALLLELGARHPRCADVGAESNAVTRHELVRAEESVARGIAGHARLRAVELEVYAVAVIRRLDSAAVQLDELPASVLDTRIVHDLLQPVSRREVTGDALAASIQLEQHVLADLVPLRAGALAQRDSRARVVPSEAARLRARTLVRVEIEKRTRERAVLPKLDARADARTVGTRQGAAVDACPIERRAAAVPAR